MNAQTPNSGSPASKGVPLASVVVSQMSVGGFGSGGGVVGGGGGGIACSTSEPVRPSVPAQASIPTKSSSLALEFPVTSTGDGATGIANGTHSLGSVVVGELAATLLDAIGEGVTLASRTGEVLWANEVCKRMPPNLRERLSVACRQFDRSHPVSPSGSTGLAGVRGELDPRDETVLLEEERAYEVIVTTAPAAAMAQVSRARAALGDGLVIVVRDVTASRRLQQKINAIDIAGSELVRFDADVVRKNNAHERLKLLEDKIGRYSRDLMHFDSLAIRLLDERTGKLELVLGYGLPPEFDAFEIRPGLEGNGITGYVASSGRSYISTDTATDKLYLPGIRGARSSLTVPLRLHDKVIGVMNVESQRVGAFTEEDLQLGEMFARYAALSLHMLDLLVVERCTVNQTVSGRVMHELSEPLEDIAHEVEMLKAEPSSKDSGTLRHLDRIQSDIESIRKRISECTAGPQSLLGVEQALADKREDPLLQGKRVLVADDEARIRDTICSVLKSKGCTVMVCDSGATAIAMLELEALKGFDLIVSDIRMPDRNGYEVFAASRRITPKAKVILMTGFGYDPHHSIVRASQEGLQSVLFKPFQVERLLEDVRAAFKAELGC